MARTPSSGGASLQNNFVATAAPDANNDSTEGYSVGSVWIDVTADERYVCLDASEGAAVWAQSTVGTAAEVVFTPAGDLAATDVQAALEELDTEKAPALGADDNYVTDAEKVVIGNTSGTNTGDEPSASTTAEGVVELAIASEVDTGTDATRGVTPDALAGSSIFGVKAVCLQVTAFDANVATGDGQAIFVIPAALNGMNLIRAEAVVYTAGTTNATTVMIRNKTDTQDMLSGAISIASGGTVGTVGTINTSFDDVVTNDVIAVDVDSVSTTAPQGLMVVLEFQLP